MRKIILGFLLYLYAISSISQQLEITTYRDTDLPFIEEELDFYNFLNPINSDIFDLNTYDPTTDNPYMLASYGHRYVGADNKDNHGGFDFWGNHTYEGIEYSESNKAPVICMCDGFISSVTNQDIPTNGGIRSVQVTCNKQSQSFNSNIKINYRHLDAIGELAAMAENSDPDTVVSISKGDIIGTMGKHGTAFFHLHLSTQVDHPENGNSFVHTARIFNPNSNILKPLTTAKIQLLDTWDDKALFRVSWPFNHTINRFEFINDSFSIVFDKEAAYDTGSEIRDSHDCIPGINVFAYQFNGKLTASARYENEKEDMPSIFPASPQRDPHFPITENSVSYVYDFIIEDIPDSAINDDFKVKLSDVWGYTVEGSLESTLGIDDNLRSNIKVYPNLTTGIINIESDILDSTLDIKLYDIGGKQLNALKMNSSNVTIYINYLSSGLYFLKIESNNNNQVFKVMKI